eukprot:jgi/Bigna1/145211/aug1.96_g19919
MEQDRKGASQETPEGEAGSNPAGTEGHRYISFVPSNKYSDKEHHHASFVELGSGKGDLSLHLHRMLQFNVASHLPTAGGKEERKPRTSVGRGSGSGVDEQENKASIRGAGCEISGMQTSTRSGGGAKKRRKHVGKGMVSVAYTLIDRMRFKSRDRRLDHLIRHENKCYKNNDSIDATITTTKTTPLLRASCCRITKDIRQLNLSEDIPSLRGADAAIFLSKHLCGPALDMCLVHIVGMSGGREEGQGDDNGKKIFGDGNDENNSSFAADPSYLRAEAASVCCSEIRKTGRTTSISIATCCHHLLDSSNVANPAFFRQDALALSEEEIALLAHASSWASIAPGKCNTGDSGKFGISVQEKRDFGRRCKLLFDISRADFLRQHGFEVQLLRYTKETTDNTLLLATCHPSSAMKIDRKSE